MISRKRYNRSILLKMTAVVLLVAAPHASAQPAAETDEDDETPAAEATEPAAKDPDISHLEIDWGQLNVDASTLSWSPASKARVAPKAGADAELSWSAKDKANGAAVTVKQPVWTLWDARVGADMNVARDQATMTGAELLSQRLANGGTLPQSSGSAWAAVTAPGVGSIWDKTAVEARIDPGQEQSKLGTSLTKTIPLDTQYSLSLQNGYNVIQQGLLPVPGIVARPARTYQTEQSAKLSIGDTGTSLIAGQSLSSTDEKWLRKIGAEQKLFGGVSISGSIGETLQGTSDKRLTAGFNHSW